MNDTATLANAMFSVFLRKSAAAPIKLIDLSLCRFFNLIFLVLFHLILVRSTVKFLSSYRFSTS